MDFRKLGWMLMLLGLIFGGVAGYYALLPHLERWSDFEAIVEATKAGYPTPNYMAMKAKRALHESRVYVFGCAGGITAFLGLAFIISGKKTEPRQPSNSA